MQIQISAFTQQLKRAATEENPFITQPNRIGDDDYTWWRPATATATASQLASQYNQWAHNNYHLILLWVFRFRCCCGWCCLRKSGPSIAQIDQHRRPHSECKRKVPVILFCNVNMEIWNTEEHTADDNQNNHNNNNNNNNNTVTGASREEVEPVSSYMNILDLQLEWSNYFLALVPNVIPGHFQCSCFNAIHDSAELSRCDGKCSGVSLCPSCGQVQEYYYATGSM